MTSRLLFFFILIISSCGPRSGVRQENSVSETSDFCGTEKPTAFEDAHLSQGQELFSRNCAACHSSHSEQTIVGPGLRNVFERLPTPGEKYFIGHLLSSDSLRTTKDSYYAGLRSSYPDFVGHDKLIYEDKITEDAVKDIISYLHADRR